LVLSGAPFEHVNEVAAGDLLLDEFIAGLFGKGLEIPGRARIGGHHTQQLAAEHFGQRLFGFQDGQRAVQAAGVEFFVDVHENPWVAAILSKA
jgi:hypothetical protein